MRRGTSCNGLPKRAAAFAAGPMDAGEAESYERHVRECDACRNELRRQERLDTLVDRLPVYRAPEMAPRSRLRGRRSLVPALAAAAVLVLLVAIPRSDRRADLLAAALAVEELTSIGGESSSLSDSPAVGARMDDVPWLGFVTCSERIVDPLDGVYICALAEGGPLGRAGVQAGEVVRTVDGRRINGSLDLNRHLVQRGVGARFRVGLERGDGTRHEVVVATIPFALGENHPFDMAWSPALQAHVSEDSPLAPVSLFEAIDDAFADRLQVPGGVRVLRALDPEEQQRTLLAGFTDLYGPGGLRGGHVIVSVDSTPVTSVSELFLALDEVDQRPFTMTVHSMGPEPTVLSFGRAEADEDDPRADREVTAGGELSAWIVNHAAAFVSNGRALERVWPGFLGSGVPFMILDDSARGTLLVIRHGPPPGFFPVDDEALPAALTGITYQSDGPPEGLEEGTYAADYHLAGDTLPALPAKGATTFNQRDFYLHEAFHGYQARIFPPVGRRVRFGEPLVDPDFLDEEFRASARAERHLLREALATSSRAEAFETVKRYFQLRTIRLEAKGPVEAVERDLERREGTAQWVGCTGAAVTTPRTDPSWMTASECVDRELAKPMEDHPNFPEADARYMRWRLYGTGGALTLLLHRYGPTDWRDRIEAGDPLDGILRAVVSG